MKTVIKITQRYGLAHQEVASEEIPCLEIGVIDNGRNDDDIYIIPSSNTSLQYVKKFCSLNDLSIEEKKIPVQVEKNGLKISIESIALIITDDFRELRFNVVKGKHFTKS